jgi:protein required for attachment to host cells
MENHLSWLLVADASKAKIYALNKLKTFKEKKANNLLLIGEYTHDGSRKKTSELTSDKMGEFGSATFASATPPKLHEADQFAHELISYLLQGIKENKFHRLIITAPPAFMGLLNKHIPNELNKLIEQRIEKDYTQFSTQDLLTNLLNHL